jgi:hypothetical protein
VQPKRPLLLGDGNVRFTLLPPLQEHGFQMQVAATVPEALSQIGNRRFYLLVADLNVANLATDSKWQTQCAKPARAA